MFFFSLCFLSNKNKIRPICTWPICRLTSPNRTFTICSTNTELSFQLESCATAAAKVEASVSLAWNPGRNAMKLLAYSMANYFRDPLSLCWWNLPTVETRTSASTRRTINAGVTLPTDLAVSSRPTTIPFIPTDCRPYSPTCSWDVISHTKCRLSPLGPMEPLG